MPRPQNRPQHVLHLACRVFQATRGALGFLAPDGTLRGYFTEGIPETQVAESLRSDGAVEIAARVASNSGPLRLSDLSSELTSPLPGLDEPGPFLGLCLQVPGPARAFLYLARARGSLPFTADDEEMLALFARGLEQGNLSEEARLLSQVTLLNKVAQAAAGSLRLAPILETAVRELDRYLPRHFCAIWLVEKGLEGEEAVLGHTSLLPREGELSQILSPGRRIVLARSPFARCYFHQEALYADWARPEDRDTLLAEQCYQAGAAASFSVPLRCGDRVLGILQALGGSRNGFTTETIQILYLVADLLGPAVTNCQLHGQLEAAYDEMRRNHGQLVVAEKMRALGELACGVAHEFNNSLCGVTGFLELVLQDPAIDPINRKYLESSKTCAESAAAVIKRVQDFASWRPRQEGQVRVDVSDLARQAWELVRSRWEGSSGSHPGVALTLSARALQGVLGDPFELRAALSNLIVNALEAMPQGGTLTLRTWDEGERVCLSVSDTGLGITEEVRRRLFEPFFTTKGERGSGLGLSITFATARRHGGEVLVASTPGQGATFTLRLPAMAGPVPEPEAIIPQPDSANAKENLSILIVEDEPSVRSFLALGLTRMGHRPSLACTVQEGLEALATQSYDLVVTDLGLPDGTGEEIVRQAPIFQPGLPVIMLTGWADTLSSVPEGVERLLGKPIALTTLKQAIEDVGKLAADRKPAVVATEV